MALTQAYIDSSGRVRDGLPSGAMHSRRKVNLGRRNGMTTLAMQPCILLWCPPPLLPPPHPIIAGMCVCKDPSVPGLLVPCTPTPTDRREFFVSIGLAMIALMGGELASFAPQTGATGPVLASATITARSDLAGGGVHNE